MSSGSVGLQIGFVVLAMALAVGFVAAVRFAGIRLRLDSIRIRASTARAAIGAGAWLLLTGLAAKAGMLRFSPFPPTMLGLLVATVALVVVIGRSEVGRRLATGLPLSILVGYQAFRVVVELLLHRAYVEGLMPIQMSYAGYNFDIVTGILAAALGVMLARGRVPTWVVGAWNVVGLLLLLNVLTIALLSAPTPLRRFHNEPANVWITAAPWVWLPAVMVLAALLGHLLVFRRMAVERGHQPA